MTKISRNAPCPCGSGKKYKKCCLNKHQQQRSTLRRPQPMVPFETSVQVAGDEDDPLIVLSNGAIDLIRAGKLEQAEMAARRLLAEFPNEPDGHERLGQIAEKRQRPADAVEHYRRAADLIAGRSDYDPEIEQDLRARARRLDEGIR
jgi:tetratricopeptide (TPR) repeat protein